MTKRNRCLQCGHRWEGKSCFRCINCRHEYVKWENFNEWRAEAMKDERYRKHCV